jgi:Tfp pilus assembly protein PilF
MNTRRLSFVVVFALSAGCSHTDQTKPADLDVRMERQAASLDSDSSKIDRQANKVVVPSKVQINWQKYFQPDPNAQERRRLAERLDAWKDAESAAELIKKAQGETVLGRFASAEVSLQQASRLEPNNGETWLELAKLSLRKRETVRAIEYLAMVKKIIDRNEDLNGELVFRYKYVLSLCYISSGDRERGHQGLSELIAIDRSFIPAYSALATSYLSQGKLEMAKFIAQRGLDRGADDPSILNILGILSQKQGKNGAARNLFERALQKNAEYGPALINLANMMIQNFEYEAAELALQKAVDTNPDNAAAYVAMASLQRRTGRKDAAVESLQKALDLDPGNGNARFNLAMIKLQEKNHRSNDALRLLIEVTQTDQSDENLKSLAHFYIDGIQEDRAH